MTQEPSARPEVSGSRRFQAWFQRTGSEALGWLLVVIGIPLMPLPGPGTIVLVSGVALLARHYSWARRLLGPLRSSAIEAARFGVAKRSRILVSFLGGVWLVGLGVVWWVSPTFEPFTVAGITVGPRLPAAGWGTGLGLISSGLVGWGLLAYSVKRWRNPASNDADG